MSDDFKICEYDTFYSWARNYIKTMSYEEKFRADDCLGKWTVNRSIYKPGSGGQKYCHKIMDNLWKEFKKESI